MFTVAACLHHHIRTFGLPLPSTGRCSATEIGTPSKHVQQVLADGKLGPRDLLIPDLATQSAACRRKSETSVQADICRRQVASDNVGTDVRLLNLPASQLPSKPSDLGSQATHSNSQQMQVSLLCCRTTHSIQQANALSEAAAHHTCYASVATWCEDCKAWGLPRSKYNTFFLCRAQSLIVRAAAATAPSDQKIRIKLKAYQPHLLQESVGLITEAARSTGAHAGGPVYLPTRCVNILVLVKQVLGWLGSIAQKCPCCLLNRCVGLAHQAKSLLRLPVACRRRIYCVLRSPHVNKDSREHFEKRTHSRLLDIKNLTAQTIDELMQLDLPAGVDVEVKL